MEGETRKRSLFKKQNPQSSKLINGCRSKAAGITTTKKMAPCTTANKCEAYLALEALPSPSPPTPPPPPNPSALVLLVVTRKRFFSAPCRFSSPDPIEKRDALVRVSTQKARSPVVLAPKSYSTRCFGSINCAASWRGWRIAQITATRTGGTALVVHDIARNRMSN